MTIRKQEMFRTFQEVIGKYYLSVGLGEQSSKAEWESALKGLLEAKQKTLGTVTNPALKRKGERECVEIEEASQMASHLNAFDRLRQHIQDDNQESFEWESKKHQNRAAFPSEGHPLYGEFLQVKGEARKKWPGVVFAGAQATSEGIHPLEAPANGAELKDAAAIMPSSMSPDENQSPTTEAESKTQLPDNSKAMALVGDLKERGKLPALDGNVGNICSLTADHTTCIADLTAVILRDCALTTAVISTSNSAMYAPANPIKTVSGAITMLGFEKVRMLALGFVLIKQMSQSAQGRNLYRLFTCSYFAGLFAMSLGRKADFENPEELFVSGLLSALPRLLLANGFPERYAAVEKRIVSEKVSTNQACMEEFGITYDSFTTEVARYWNMPENVSNVMDNGDSRTLYSNIVAGGTQIADMMFGNVPGGPSALSAAESNLRTVLGIKDFELDDFVTETCEEDSNVKQFFKINAKDVDRMVKSVGWGKVDSSQVAGTLPYGEATQKMREREQDPALIVGQYLSDLALCMRKSPDINRMLMTAMEAIYRCVRPDFVLVGFINKQSQLVEGRFLLGSSTTARPTDFRVTVADRKSPVNRCMLTRKPLTVMVEPELPLPFLQALKLKSIRLIPIVAVDNPVGIFILGREKIQSYAMREEMWLEAIVSNVSMGFERAKSSLSSLKLDRSAALTNIT